MLWKIMIYFNEPWGCYGYDTMKVGALWAWRVPGADCAPVSILRCAFCPPNWWGRKTGSWPSCTLKAAEQEAIRSAHCCPCLQRRQCHPIDNKGKHAMTGINLHPVDITLCLQMETVSLSSIKQQRRAPIMLFMSCQTHDGDTVMCLLHS